MSAASEFIEEVLLHWPPYRWDEDQEASWTKSMTLELRIFDPAVLAKAIAHMKRTRKDRRTPTVAECISACAEALRWINIEKGKQALPIEEQKQTLSEYSQDRIKLANDLVMGSLGKQAAKEGWILSLHDFCRNKLRLPMSHEVDKCKKGAKEFDESYRLAVKGGWPQAAALEQLGAKMLKKRQELSDMVLHGVMK